MRDRHDRFRTFILVGAVSMAAGCNASRSPSPEDDAVGNVPSARAQIERGPVRVTVEFSPQPAQLSDEPTLTLTIDHEPDVEIKKPPFGESLGDFLIRDFREPLPRMEGKRQVFQQIYTLEPTQSGQLVIAPIVLNFVDNRPDGGGQEYTLETEPLAVEVTSVVDSSAPSLADLKPAEGPVELPAASSPLRWWLTAIAIVAVGFGVALYLWLRRRRADTATELSPQELAYLELQEMIEKNLGEQDVKLYYVELTGIVRRYIERTTGVHAPEQTTEEFLREIGAGRVFAHDERARLKAFLESADLVKYAAVTPRPDDVEESFERAKAFLGLATREAAAA